MKLHVAQNQEYQGDNWWKWSIWMEGPDADLDRIQEVTYRLHSSFRDPLRTKKERSDKFKLETSGWGVFAIHVKVLFKDGSVQKLKHDLELSFPDGTLNID